MTLQVTVVGNECIKYFDALVIIMVLTRFYTSLSTTVVMIKLALVKHYFEHQTAEIILLRNTCIDTAKEKLKYNLTLYIFVWCPSVTNFSIIDL